MNILGWLLFGLVAGVLANILDPQPKKGGLLGAMILGIMGSVVGGFLGYLVFGIGIIGFNLVSFSIAVLCSMLLLIVGKALIR